MKVQAWNSTLSVNTENRLQPGTGPARTEWRRKPARAKTAVVICPNPGCRLFLPGDVEDVNPELVCQCGADWTETPAPERVAPTVRRPAKPRKPLAQRGSRAGAASGQPRETDFPAAERRKVRARSGGVCELAGCAADAVAMHHRRRREVGPHTAVNALHCCVGCHVPVVHANPVWSAERGYIVRSTGDPAAAPMLTDSGWVLLTGDGSYEPTTAPERVA